MGHVKSTATWLQVTGTSSCIVLMLAWSLEPTENILRSIVVMNTVSLGKVAPFKMPTKPHKPSIARSGARANLLHIIKTGNQTNNQSGLKGWNKPSFDIGRPQIVACPPQVHS